MSRQDTAEVSEESEVSESVEVYNSAVVIFVMLRNYAEYLSNS